MPVPPPNDSAGKDFANAMLYGQDFAGQDLDDANFEHANLDNARLNGASLRGANLRSARLCDASLREADLEDADLRDAVLGETTVEGASFKRADLRGAYLYRLRGWESIASIEGAKVYGVKEAPDGFVEWALGRGALQEAPPPTNGERWANRLTAVLSAAGRALHRLNTLLEILPFHTKQSHRRIAKRGTKAVVKWRTRNEGRYMNLEGAALPGAKLAEAPLSGANMRGINLSGANLYGAVLGQTLEGANLANADLRYATISGDLRRANLEKAKLKGALAMMADFDDAKLCGATLDAADFSAARLPRADLRDSDCSHASFDDAHLDGALLSGACMADANFYEATLRRCDLAGVDLARANLCNADLDGVTHFDQIPAIKGASIQGVRNAPAGFIDWALANGAVQEKRNRSWSPLDDRKAKADRVREELAEHMRRHHNIRRTLWMPTLAGLLFLVTGIGGMVWGALLPMSQAFQMRNWKAAECQIVRSGFVAVHYEWLPEIPEASLSTPEIEYRYQWAGQDYTGGDFRVKPSLFATAEEAEAFVARYPEGAAATCYVNTEQPDHAVLEKATFHWGMLLILFLSTIWALAGALLAFASVNHYEQGIR